MDPISPDDVLLHLIDNVSNIVSAAAENRTESFSEFSMRQKTLMGTFALEIPGVRPSLAMMTELQTLLEAAINTIQSRMAFNRAEMRTLGMKKKILSAYGTVTVSDRSRE